MQSCSKCGKKMVPVVNLNGSVSEILKELAKETQTMRWSCPDCNIERGAPLKASEIEEVKSYIRRQKKQWWQFWIR